MGATSARTAGRLRQLIESQVAGFALALFMVQHSADRGRSHDTKPAR